MVFFEISWEGLVSGSLIIDGGFNGINDFFSGIYLIKIMDVNGCIKFYMREVGGLDNDFEIFLDLKEDECGSEDIIVVIIFGGEVNYIVSWNGFIDGFIIIDGNYLEIFDLVVGIYIVDVMDVNGCFVSVIINVMVVIV